MPRAKRKRDLCIVCFSCVCAGDPAATACMSLKLCRTALHCEGTRRRKTVRNQTRTEMHTVQELLPTKETFLFVFVSTITAPPPSPHSILSRGGQNYVLMVLRVNALNSAFVEMRHCQFQLISRLSQSHCQSKRGGKSISCQQHGCQVNMHAGACS